MQDYILKKYSENIRFFIQKVKITPENYTNKKTVEKRWKVHFRYNQEGKKLQDNSQHRKYFLMVKESK